MVRRMMEIKGYGLFRGKIFKKCEASKYTMVFCSNVKNFLLASLSNPDLAELLTPNIGLVTSLLSEPACRLIKPIKINYNYIEVLPEGCCFDISRKKFVMNPELNGESPRAFVKYTYQEDRCPYPLKFIQGI